MHLKWAVQPLHWSHDTVARLLWHPTRWHAMAPCLQKQSNSKTAKTCRHTKFLCYICLSLSISSTSNSPKIRPRPRGPRDAATNKDGPTSWLPSCGRESPTCHLQRTESPPTRTNESEWIFSRWKIGKKNRKCYTHLYIFIHFYTCLFIHVRPNPDVAPHLQSSWSSSWWSSSSH